MPSEDKTESATLRIKRALVHRACTNFRGAEMIAELNRRYLQRQALLQIKDEDILQTFEAAANAHREYRQDILDCLRKTDFNREEDPEIQQLIIDDLFEQELAIHLLRTEGMPENELPALSPALARLNAYEQRHRKTSGQEELAWSDQGTQVKNARIRARILLTQPVPYLH